MKRVLFVCYMQYPELWKDGLWAALQLLKNKYEIVTLNLYEDETLKRPARTDLFDGVDFVLGWGAFGSPVDRYLQRNTNRIHSPIGLCIGGTASPPDKIDTYSVLYYETEWYRPFIQHHSKPIHAFGINTDIYKLNEESNVNLDPNGSGCISSLSFVGSRDEVGKRSANGISGEPNGESVGRGASASVADDQRNREGNEGSIPQAMATGNIGLSTERDSLSSGDSRSVVRASSDGDHATERPFDVLTVGSFSLWKRHQLLTLKGGVRLAVGEIQRGNRQESYQIIQTLLEAGVGVMDMVQPEQLARLYRASKLAYIPCELHGGGERAVLEARACGIPVEVELDNPKLLELTKSPLWDHYYYAKQLEKGFKYASPE